jgi:hypothetical protein
LSPLVQCRPCRPYGEFPADLHYRGTDSAALAALEAQRPARPILQPGGKTALHDAQSEKARTGPTDTEITPGGVLFGFGHLDCHDYDAVSYVTLLLRQYAAAFGEVSAVAGRWQAVLGAATSTRRAVPPVVGEVGARACNWRRRVRCRRSAFAPSKVG